jgi:general secretion pathway protein C
MTASYRDKMIKQDLQKILMQATALPHFQDGAIVGFSLTQIDQDSIFAKGGFVDSDIITSVNGIPMNSIPGAIKLLNSLREAPSIDVEVLRDGAKRNVQLKVD